MALPNVVPSFSQKARTGKETSFKEIVKKTEKNSGRQKVGKSLIDQWPIELLVPHKNNAESLLRMLVFPSR